MKSAVAVLFVATLSVLGFSGFPRSGEASSDAIVVFVNSKITVDSISTDDLKLLYLKMKTSLKDGTKVVPVHAKAGSALRKVFVKKVLGMDESAEMKFWQDQKIKVGTTPPSEFNNTQKAVFSLTRGIGYCFESDYVVGVNKVVLKL